MKPIIRAFFDHDTWTLTYVVHDPASRDAVVIDPVLDYDPLLSQTDTASLKQLERYFGEQGLRLRGVLETHAHADHLSGAAFLAERYSVPVAIGKGIGAVQKAFSTIFNYDESVPTDGSQFQILLDADQIVHFGTLEVKALATPGHTPACVSYLIGDAVFTGDALFMEDFGTGRTDFPGGSAGDLYHSVHDVLFALPEDTRVFVGHDYQPGGRELAFESTIGREKSSNVHLRGDTPAEQFIEFRKARDAGLKPPRLIYQSIQVNVFGGQLPAEEKNGVRYLRTPINLRCRTDDAGMKLNERCGLPEHQAAE